MERIQFITHKGKRILLEDFTSVKPGPEFYENIKKAQELIAKQPPKSVLAVFDVTGISFNSDMINVMKEFTKANTPYIKTATVVGITGLISIALGVVSKFAGREFLSFKTRDEALDYLVTH
jgi:hypothetical protein